MLLGVIDVSAILDQYRNREPEILSDFDVSKIEVSGTSSMHF